MSVDKYTFLAHMSFKYVQGIFSSYPVLQLTLLPVLKQSCNDRPPNWAISVIRYLDTQFVFLYNIYSYLNKLNKMVLAFVAKY